MGSFIVLIDIQGFEDKIFNGHFMFDGQCDGCGGQN